MNVNATTEEESILNTRYIMWHPESRPYPVLYLMTSDQSSCLGSTQDEGHATSSSPIRPFSVCYLSVKRAVGLYKNKRNCFVFHKYTSSFAQTML